MDNIFTNFRPNNFKEWSMTAVDKIEAVIDPENAARPVDLPAS